MKTSCFYNKITCFWTSLVLEPKNVSVLLYKLMWVSNQVPPSAVGFTYKCVKRKYNMVARATAFLLLLQVLFFLSQISTSYSLGEIYLFITVFFISFACKNSFVSLTLRPWALKPDWLTLVKFHNANIHKGKCIKLTVTHTHVYLHLLCTDVIIPCAFTWNK